MIVDAEAEGHKAALRSFAYANAVEQLHAKLYQKAAEKMAKMEAVDYYVCSVCGNTVEREAPETCPVCGAKAKAFFKVE
jgi:rubrerythrin